MLLKRRARSAPSSGLETAFQRVLSTDLAKTYKPDPKAYQLGVGAIQLPREQILFAAFAGWYAAGAMAFGFSTFCVNRLGTSPEQLGAVADGEGKTLNDMLAFAGQ